MPAPNREKFVQQVIEIVREKFPAAKVSRADQPFSIKINGQIASLENLFRSASLQPEQMTQFVSQWMLEMVRASEGTPDHNATFEALSERILPVILPESQPGRAPGGPMVFQPFVAKLVICYAVDSDRTLWYVAQPTFERWGASLDQLHEKAIENLVSRSQSIAAHAAQDPDGRVNLILFQTMDGYDASRLLLPTLNERLREHLGSPFVAGIPNRDILLCFRNDEPTVDRLRTQIAADFGKMPHPITESLLLVTPDGVAPFE